MAWFIIQSERKTYTKFIVEAESEEMALSDADNWEYIGYLDGYDTSSEVVGEQFRDKKAALNDLASVVDGF
ncbi:MAG: hypothetical protein A2W35_19310 [Chloroflexi bacterium RBG_16_57_11]|nr:MAG: hypothetical protein A2W35_19310 [Chloroflexi bacterium RBG_16_57_11]